MNNNTIIGISLGTTNACVAIMTENGPFVIPNQAGSNMTPAVVVYTQNGVFAGHLAKNHMAINPQGTFYGIKTLLGKTFSEIAYGRKKYSFNVVSDRSRNDAVALALNGRLYTPQEVTARIILDLKLTAEKYLGFKVEKAVISVPASFNTAQRQATKDAGMIAGLQDCSLINEPSAAALAYGFNTNNSGKIAVYDFGGGTFDISIIDINEGIFEIWASRGNTNLGGKDIDDAIMEFLIQQITRATGINLEIDLDKITYFALLQRIIIASENAKKALSHSAEYEINLPDLIMSKETPIHFTYLLTRSKMEEIVKSIIEKTIEPCQKVLADARLSANDINEVIFVGGMTRMPLVQETVKKFFAKKPCKNLHPEEAVALGAAIQAGILNGEVQDLMLLDITSISLGIETLGGVMTRIIERNTTIPTKKSQVFSTASDNQPAISVKVYQGEREMARDNKLIGEFEFSGIPPAPRGIPQIEVTFDFNIDGLLFVSSKELKTGKELNTTINLSSDLSKEGIEVLKRVVALNPNLS